jgi:energy-coupling factor transporter transmembrane protein EcfT
MGMVSLAIILVLGLVGFLIVVLLKRGKKQHVPFLWIFWSVQGASFLVLVLQILAANSPFVAAWLAGWGVFLIQLFEGRGWDLITPLDEAGNLNLQLDKIFLAVLSYLPITVFRILYTQHLHRRLKKEIAKLIVRVEHLEKIQKKEKDV